MDFQIDFISILLEEVALEGLDGITLEALWLRLETRRNVELPVEDIYSKRYYFDTIKQHEAIEAFELPEERGALVIYDFEKHLDPGTNLYIEPNRDNEVDIYPFHPIHDIENCIMGSCLFYKIRVNITQVIRFLSYEQTLERYQNKLVFVANQDTRMKYLILSKNNHIPNNIALSHITYSLLERIGRSRYIGSMDITKETTNISPKDLFYLRKDLLFFHLITRQFINKQAKKFIIRQPLYYLKRFHKEHLSKISLLMKTIIEELKNAVETNHILPVKHFSGAFGQISTFSVKKLIHYFHLDHKLKDKELPYSVVYPMLPKSDWFKKSNNRIEKYESCLELVDLNIDVDKVIKEDLDSGETYELDDEDEDEETAEEEDDSSIQENKENKNMDLPKIILSQVADTDSYLYGSYVSETESSDEDFLHDEQSEDESEVIKETVSHPCFKSRHGMLDSKHLPIDLSTSQQVLRNLDKAGSEGLSNRSISSVLSFTRGEERYFIRSIKPFIDTYRKDNGRQRSNYCRLLKYKHLKIECEPDLNDDASPSKRLKADPEHTGTNHTMSERAVSETSLILADSLNESSETILCQTDDCQYDTNESSIEDETTFNDTGDMSITSNFDSSSHQKNKFDSSKIDFSKFYFKEIQKEVNRNINFDTFLNNTFKSEVAVQRAIDILNFFKVNKAIRYTRDITIYIIKRDKERGYLKKIDRKTLARMFNHLVDGGYLKYFNLVIKKNNLSPEEVVRITAKPDVPLNHPVLFETLDKFTLDKIQTSKVKQNPPKVTFQAQIDSCVSNTKMQASSTDTTTKIIQTKQKLIQDVHYDGRNVDSIQVTFQEIQKDLGLSLEELFDTALMMSRVQTILKFISEKNVIINTTELVKVICTEDEKLNYSAKIDRKTLGKMMDKLTDNGYIKNINIMFNAQRTDTTEKSVRCYATLNLKTDDPDFTTAVEKEKMIFWYSISSPTKNTIYVELPGPEPYPKFSRMRILHKLLFQMIWNDAEPIADQVQARLNLQNNCNVELPDNHPPIYKDTELSSLTFLRPIAPPIGYPKGFVFFGEFFPMIPINVFLQCVHITSGMTDIGEFYSHPVKKYYPIKSTSADVFKALTRQQSGRKYVAIMYDNLLHLATIGLLQFGKKQGPEKESFIFYLNKKASLKDTTIAEAGYVQLKPTNNLSTIFHQFDSSDDIDKYWLESLRICFNTPLGLRSLGLGQTIISYKSLKHKKELMSYCKHQDDMASIMKNDDGTQPGDKLGAAGYDSSLFSHMKRNWCLKSGEKENISNEIKKVKPQVVKFKRGLKNTSIRNKSTANPLQKQKPVERVVQERSNSSKKKKTRSSILEQSSLTQTAMKRIRHAIKWTDRDSDVLHIINFLYKLFKIKPCNGLTREVHCKLLPENTTSSKILLHYYRRTLKLPGVKERALLLQAEIRHISDLREILISHVQQFRGLGKSKKCKAYKYFIDNLENLVRKIVQTVVENTESVNRKSFPCSYNEFKTKYCVISNRECFEEFYPVTNNVRDIQMVVLLNLIHGSLAFADESNSHSSLEYLNAYQQYPEALIYKAVRTLKKHQIIASSKGKHRRSNDLITPVQVKGYKLSARYCFKLTLNEIHTSSFHSSYMEYRNIMQTHESSYEIKNVNSGCLHLVISILEDDLADLSIIVPKPLLLIDPKIEKLDKSYKEILDRYYKLVEHYKVGGTVNKVLSKEYDEDDDDDDDCKLENVPPMNKFTAARLAMYTLKDVLLKERINTQHAQRLLTLNSCKIEITNYNKMKVFYEQYRSSVFVKKITAQLEVPSLTENKIVPNLRNDLEKRVVNFIDTKLECGATLEEIRLQFGSNKKVKTALEKLTAKHIVICVGCITESYVHNRHCSPWLLKCSQNKKDKNPPKEIIVYPWVHIDGTINKRVLDHMIACILSYILTNPGCTLYSIQEYYAFTHQPIHIKILVDILARFDCVSRYVITQSKCSLFTKPTIICTPATGLEDPRSIYVEGLSSAALKLGLFIGDKKYETDFLENFCIQVENNKASNDLDLDDDFL